jgi:hypothetical protein
MISKHYLLINTLCVKYELKDCVSTMHNRYHRLLFFVGRVQMSSLIRVSCWDFFFILPLIDDLRDTKVLIGRVHEHWTRSGTCRHQPIWLAGSVIGPDRFGAGAERPPLDRYAQFRLHCGAWLHWCRYENRGTLFFLDFMLYLLINISN